ncbi:MAG: LysE family translocator [Gammaproteobacteria bacterium]|nr:LysE family translocator [Gammaproteobacteria bacterium]
MELYISLASVLGALLIGAISPGPSFVLVARTSIAVSRTDGLYMAIGMGIGGAIFSVLVLAGLQAILASVPWLYMALKLFGGLYLVYLAVRIWLGAKQPVVISSDEKSLPGTAMKSFLMALLTQISNPKAVVIYGSIFAALLPPDMPLFAILALPFLVFLVEAGWYTIVAITLSSKSSTVIYLNSKAAIDRAASMVMGTLGLKLVSETLRVTKT